MKRTLALVCSAVLAVTISPFAALAAPSGDRGGVSASASANVERAASTTSPQSAPFADSVDRKKKCTWMCKQTTLPQIDESAHFVNGNKDILQFTDTEISLYNIDTQTLIDIDYPADTDVISLETAVSLDGDVVYFFAEYENDDGGRFFQVDTQTLELTNVTPPDDNFDPRNVSSLAVDPLGRGYLFLREFAGTKLCLVSVGDDWFCSESFGESGRNSPIFAGTGGDAVTVLGVDDLSYFVYSFDADDLSMSSSEIQVSGGRKVRFGDAAQMLGGSMVFTDFFDPNNGPKNTRVYLINSSGTVTDTHTFRGRFQTADIVGPAYSPFVYLFGRSYNSRGDSARNETLYEINWIEGELKIRKSMTVPPDRNFDSPDRFVADKLGRYLLGIGDGPAYVVPVGSGFVSNVDVTAEIDGGRSGWNITWDYLNLAPRPARNYVVSYKAPGARKWEVVATVSAADEHTYLFTRGVAGGDIKVTPQGVKIKDRFIGAARLPEIG